MQGTPSFAIQTLLVTLVLNAILLAVAYVVGGVFATFGIGFLITMLLWFAIQTIGKRFIERAAVRPATEVLSQAPAAMPPKALPLPYETSAIQLLSILQRKGRLIDFLQEDLSTHQDAQIGAAVRTIHEGCKQALAEYVELEPIFTEEEGSPITVERGFNAHAIRLTGNIVGDPPFKGALRHRGWRVVQVDLPAQSPAQQKERIVATAEVEVNA